MDLDSTICEVYGLTKQGAARGYTGVRGYHPLLASCAGDSAGGGATQLLHARLRGGNAGSGRGAGSFVAEVLTRLRDALPPNQSGRQGTVTLRADSGFYSRAVIGVEDLAERLRPPGQRDRGKGCDPVETGSGGKHAADLKDPTGPRVQARGTGGGPAVACRRRPGPAIGSSGISQPGRRSASCRGGKSCALRG